MFVLTKTSSLDLGSIFFTGFDPETGRACISDRIDNAKLFPSAELASQYQRAYQIGSFSVKTDWEAKN